MRVYAGLLHVCIYVYIMYFEVYMNIYIMLFYLCEHMYIELFSVCRICEEGKTRGQELQRKGMIEC